MKQIGLMIISLLLALAGIAIWAYLLYKILVFVNATELMFFLYWAYVPTVAIASIISKLMEKV